MLFRKKIERACGYCVHSVEVDEQTVRCRKKGTRDKDSKCMHFKYDPCKRIPSKPKALDFNKYEEYDYSL